MKRYTKTRIKLSKGIYKDASGIAIIVSVKGKPREFRQDVNGRTYKTFSLAELRDERKRISARELQRSDRADEAAEAFAQDVAVYLKTLSGRTKEDADDQLQHWLTVFADRPRHTLTALELREHASTWTCAASTFNHRRQALISLYTALDGPSAPNPARAIPKRQEIAGAPRALPYTVIRAALAAMPDTQSRARLALMAYTGLPQMQIQKLTPADWEKTRLRVSPRRKGAGAVGRWIPLSPEAREAMKDFDRLNCWGNFSRSSLCKAWKQYGPPGSSPYSLRHSWITELYRRSKGDVLALQQLALHSRLEQTQRYAAAGIHDRMRALVVPRKFATKKSTDRGKTRESDVAGVQSKKRRKSSRKG